MLYPNWMTQEDIAAVDSFQNFLSWGELPSTGHDLAPCRDVPPAWWAYALGSTQFCPPVGTL